MLQSISNIAVFAQAADGVVTVPFYNTGWFVFLLLIAAVSLGIVLGKMIGNGLKLPEYGQNVSIVLVALFVAGLMIWAKWPPKLGVDLRGGINMIGSLNLDAFVEDDSFGTTRPKAKDIIPALVRRVNPSGTKEIMIRALGDDKIEVTIPSVDLQEADDIWDRLVKAGKLEFRILAADQRFAPQRDLAKEMADQGGRGRKVVDASGKTVAIWVALARVAQEEGAPNKIAPFKYVPGNGDLVRDKSTGRILNLSEVPYSNNPDLHGRELAVWCKKVGVRTPQILVIQPSADQNVEGKHLKSVRSTIDERGRGAVAFTTTGEGSRLMGMLTRMNEKLPMGIVLDGQLHSAPVIQTAIYKNGQITGEFTPEEVDELIINLESGKLDVALNKSPISRDFIESNLGEELKEKGIWAIGFSLSMVLVFMLIYYRFAGIVATVGLLLNLVLILALVMAINQPITLTGLAGLVLTVGMSVDANVLIFERIREELDRGAALRMAIRNGFDKATTTIVDANVTTLITAIVLYVIGTEQIKGFSVTLILGILISMFTAIFVSRLIFNIFERKRWLTKLSMTRILEKNKWNFLNKIGLTGVGSALLIIVGIAGIYLLGPKILDHDLRGGSTAQMVFVEPQEVDRIREELDAQNFEHKGEKIEFMVSGFGSLNDPSEANRRFKVDSNLPAWEGEDIEPRFDQLDEILAKVFAGKLVLHHVEFNANTPKSSTGGADKQETDKSNPPNPTTPEKTEPSVGLKWEAGPAPIVTSLSSLTSSMLSYQDPAKSTQEKSDPADSKTADSKTADSKTADSKTADAESKQQAPASTDAGSDKSPEGKQDPASEKQAAPPEKAAPKGTQDPAAAGGDFPTEKEPLNLQSDAIFVTREMTVTPEVSGKTLRALIVEASERAELALEEDQVTVNSPDVELDESPLTTISEKWSVRMQVNKEENADKILEVWAERFNKEPYFPTTSKVGGQIAGQTQVQALVAIIASLLGIIAYVWIRFQNVAFGLAAVIALIHDVLIVLGAIAISHWLARSLGFLGIDEFKISLEIVAALLTVIGYSLNDTIVVFDRIREVRGKRSEITADMINTSISQTLSRTILTSVTTFIVVFILYCFGGEAIHGFAFALVIGVMVGTYSSIFIASPALLWLMNTVGLNPGEVDVAAE